ncbi:hypothetical protein ACH5RR_038825 [Cinchona calisaya]|uniref:PGG domain-containing protein n=1 Tax=Cinchona calisaya TaxID=153742 RepID=A0ABD2XZR7_9GENT
MDQMSAQTVQNQEINALYALLKQDPNFLENIDQKPFTDTPLHAAASLGHTHLALEIMNLKPSFGKKLNQDGFSPLHLALQNGHSQTVRRMIHHHPELIRVPGREKITPLHYVAETHDTQLLAEFLLACPSSIQDLTIRGDTAIHVAVKNKNIRALKVLLGWLHRTNKEEVLSRRNEEGNTLLHIAVIGNQLEAVKVLINKVKRNEKNLRGLTAYDIAVQTSSEENKEIRSLLHRVGARKAESLPQFDTLSKFLSSKEGIIERFLRAFIYIEKELTLEMRNVLLVVAILIATATYQGVLSPPGGVWQGEGTISPTIKTTNALKDTASTGISPSVAPISPHFKNPVGKVVMSSKSSFTQFMSANSIAFILSTGVILLVLHGRPYTIILHASLGFLAYGYSTAIETIFLPNFFTRFLVMGCWIAFASVFALKAFLYTVKSLAFNLWWQPRYSLVATNFIYQIRTKYLQSLIIFAHRLKMQHQVSK